MDESIDKLWHRLGKVAIVDAFVNDGKDQLILHLAGTDHILSTMKLEADGDCCSSSWIEHISNVEALHMAQFLRWSYVHLPDLVITSKLSESDAAQYSSGELKFYFFQITTRKGDAVIEMRNSSNGYYGGSLLLKDFGPTAEGEDEWLKRNGFRRVGEVYG